MPPDRDHGGAGLDSMVDQYGIKRNGSVVALRGFRMCGGDHVRGGRRCDSSQDDLGPLSRSFPINLFSETPWRSIDSMRILYFSFVELDIPIACRTHTLGVLKGFANQGCQVDALIPRPTKIFPQIPGVRFFYLWPWQFSPIGIVWVKLLCGLMMLWLCLKNRYDFIYVRELQLNPGPRLCSKAFKIPLYIEINDLLVPCLSNAGAHPGFVSLIARHQQMDCRQASGLIVPSVPMRQWLVDHYRLEPTKVHLVLNGADRPAEHPSTKREARGRLGIPQDCFCVGFVGNLYGRYDFDTLLDSLRACRTKIPPFYLLLIGDGSLKNDLQQKIIECGLEKKALFTGYIEHELLGRYIPAMDLGM